jgi:hypothetical protein
MDPALSSLKRSGSGTKAQTPVSILSKLFVIDQAEKDQNNVVLRK